MTMPMDLPALVSVADNPLPPLTAWVVILGVTLAVTALGYLVGRGSQRPRLSAALDELEVANRRHQRDHDQQDKAITALRDELTEMERLTGCLPEFAHRLTACEEVETTCAQMLAIIQTMLPAEKTCILLPEETGYIPWVASGIDPATLRQEIIPFGSGKLGWVSQRGIITYAAQLAQETAAIRSHVFGEDEVVDADIYIPLNQGKRALGMITLKALKRRPRFERQILRALKELFSTALAGNRAFQQVAQRANRDGLTGLYNMTFFKQHLEIELHKAERNHTRLSLFMLDIDHFKFYNDHHGHQAGDEILRQVGSLFREHTRAVDIAARYGGKEFIVLTPELDRPDVLQFAERFRDLFLANPFPHKDEQPEGTLSFSGGIATYPLDGTSIEELIRAANGALYQAKANNRNQVVAARGPVAV